MHVLIKCRCPEHYDAADAAIIELTEYTILMLDKRMAQARAMFEPDFYGTKWWDYTPTFIVCGGPESVGSDMSEEDFEAALESNRYVLLRDSSGLSFDLSTMETARMSPVVLTITAMKDASGVKAGFYWTGTDKYIGADGRVETYEMYQDTVDEWAELIGCTEMLKKVRSCRGVE